MSGGCVILNQILEQRGGVQTPPFFVEEVESWLLWAKYNMNNNPNDNNQTLVNLAEAALRPLGFEVLEVTQGRDGGETIALIRIDRLDEQPVTMDDIITASRAAEAEFDRVDPIEGEYRLEVESPGSKRPLTRARHFERMLGLKAKVKTAERTFTGQIKAVDGEQITFNVSGEDLTVEVGDIKANLAEFPDRHR